MSIREAHRLTLKQCREIEENQYRSKNACRDYYPESVQARIWEITARQAEKNIRALMANMRMIDPDAPPPLPPECDEGIPEAQKYFEWTYL